jgi:Tfp pilus assembly protein FimT
MKKQFQLGFTFIELLLVIALTMIIAVVSTIFYTRFFTQNAVANTVDQLAGDFRKAQIYAMMGKQNGNWGVAYNSNTIYLYQGASFASRNTAFDEKFSVNTNITITGLTDSNFARSTGLPNATATINVSGNGQTQTLTLNNQGMLAKNGSTGGGSDTPTPTPNTGPWFNTSYLFKKKITIDHTKVSGGANLTNFPILISLTDADLKTTGNGGSVQNSNGYDIIFTDSNETTKLDHEIEKYTASTGQIVMWIRIPSLSASVDTDIYMYYDNASIATTQESSTAVWDSNFKGVWHMDQTAGSQQDSTSNGSSANATGSPGYNATGQIGSAVSFPGTTGNNFVVTDPADGHLDFGTGSFTYGSWIYMNSAPSGFYDFIYKGGTSNSDTGYANYINSSPSLNGKISDGTATKTTSTGSVGAGTWYYFVTVIDRTSNLLHVYLNGIDQTTVSISATGAIANAKNLYFGSNDTGNPLNGRVDEIHISNIARSQGWIATEYNNQSSPATFYTVGAATGQ